MYDTVCSAPNELRHSEGVHVERTANGELSTEANNESETVPQREHDHKPGVTHACVCTIAVANAWECWMSHSIWHFVPLTDGGTHTYCSIVTPEQDVHSFQLKKVST